MADPSPFARLPLQRSESRSSLAPSSPLATQYPHVYHYVHNLFQSAASEAPIKEAHPLSVSSSTGSGSGSNSEDEKPKAPERKSTRTVSVSSNASAASTPSTDTQGSSKPSSEEKEETIRVIVDLLKDEKEEQVKDVLKQKLGPMGQDDAWMDQVCLDIMHKHRDDMDHIPYAAHLAPIRPKASPSITHALPHRPFTPTRVPSFRSRTPLARAQSPAPLPGSGVIGQPSPSATPTHSAPGTPTFAHAALNNPLVQLTAERLLGGTGSSASAFLSGSNQGSPKSAHASPATSPKASHTKPNLLTGGKPHMNLPSPFLPGGGDPWAQFGRLASPVGTPPALSRTSSNLAIAQPLTAANLHHASLNQSPDVANGMQIPRHEMDDAGVDDIFSTSAMDRHAKYLPHQDDDEDDEFSPFAKPPHDPLSTSPATKLQVSAKAFDPTRLGAPSMDPNAPGFMPGNGRSFENEYTPEAPAEEGQYLGDGMTPLDVLQSVFTTLPPGELEEALVKSGYEFEGAMALLIAQNGGTRSATSGASTPTGLRPEVRGFRPGGRDAGYFYQGGRGNAPYGTGHLSPRFAMGGPGTRSPGGGLKMCRYYLAGECRRADCRFSHDVDRALCRFWLRGQCAKGDMCEFIHALPNVDPNQLSNQLSRLELANDGTARARTPPVDEFPDLNFPQGRGRGAPFDPSRNRFANAVKRPLAPAQQHTMVTGGRFAAAPPRRFPGPPFAARGPPPAPMPRPSPRIKLRPPTLLPTLPTGAALNELYLDARQGAIRLGQARNACLARAADAWRRGDGAAAKRFSREANVLNERMSAEGAEAAGNLVKQRRAQAQEAIQNRGDWSDDPGDRAIKGKECANGLGVIMGIASASSLGPEGNSLSPEERTEVLLDLHMLHANEGTDVLEDFLLALERDSFLGLAYIIVGEDRHTGTQDPGRGASRYRLATAVKQFLARYNYPWSEGGGCICVDPATHM